MDDEIRREFDRIWSRIDHMDDQGTRGVVSVQVQITELIKDLHDLKLEMNTRLTTNAQAKRWLWAQLIAMMAMIGGLVSVAIQIRGG